MSKSEMVKALQNAGFVVIGGEYLPQWPGSLGFTSSEGEDDLTAFIVKHDVFDDEYLVKRYHRGLWFLASRGWTPQEAVGRFRLVVEAERSGVLPGFDWVTSAEAGMQGLSNGRLNIAPLYDWGAWTIMEISTREMVSRKEWDLSEIPKVLEAKRKYGL